MIFKKKKLGSYVYGSLRLCVFIFKKICMLIFSIIAINFCRVLRSMLPLKMIWWISLNCFFDKTVRRFSSTSHSALHDVHTEQPYIHTNLNFSRQHVWVFVFSLQDWIFNLNIWGYRIFFFVNLEGTVYNVFLWYVA